MMLDRSRLVTVSVRRRETPTQRNASLWLLCFHPDQVRKVPIAEASRGRPTDYPLYALLVESSKARLRHHTTANRERPLGHD